jgi:SSS family solute:Na+ symporter
VLSDPTTYVSLLYIALVTAVGFAIALQARDRGVLEYFLAGRTIGSIVLALSIGVTTLGAIGVVLLINPDIHSQGSALLALAVLFLLLIILGTVVAPKYRAVPVLTAPGLVARRFGRGAGAAIGAAFVLLIVAVRLPMVLLGGSWVVSRLSGWEPLTTAMLILVLAGLYTTAGGFPSVILTQAVQGVVVIVSVFGLLVLGLVGQPLVVDHPLAQVSTQPPGSVALLVLSLAVIALWYFWSDQVNIQRVLSASDNIESRRGVLLSVAFTAVIALLGLNIIGAGTVLDGPPPVHPLSAMVGSVLVLSLTLSTAAGMLQSAASMVTLDLVRPFRKSATELSLVLVGRLSTTGVAVVVLLLVSALGPLNPSQLAGFMDAHVVVAPPAAALFIGVLFFRRMTRQGAVAALLSGAVMALAFIALPRQWNLPAASFSILSFLASLCAMLIVSFRSTAAERSGTRVPAEVEVESGHPGPVATR